MLGRLVIGTCCTFFLLISIANIRAIITTPAFNEAARLESTTGDWKVSVGKAHYDHSEYLFLLGYGFLNADALSLSNLGTDNEVATPEILLVRYKRAISLLKESLALSPSNSHGWASLAWAHALSGNILEARSAMVKSWGLAPHNLDLAVSRLSFIELISDTLQTTESSSLDEAENLGTFSDSQTYEFHHSHAFEAAGILPKQLYKNFPRT